MTEGWQRSDRMDDPAKGIDNGNSAAWPGQLTCNAHACYSITLPRKRNPKMGLVSSNLVTRLARQIEKLILDGFKSYSINSLDGTHLSAPSSTSTHLESQKSSMLFILSSVSLTCLPCMFRIISCDTLFDKYLFSLRCVLRINRILSINMDKMISQRHL
jgi:hypothetical protein